MKNFIIILTFLSVLNSVVAQDTPKRFEFGSTILTVNSFSMAAMEKDKSYSTFDAAVPPSMQFIHGIFFRYTKNKLALRVQTSYSYYSASNTYTTEAWPHGPVGSDINNKDFQVGAGAQVSIIKQKQWLYTFAVIAYRHVKSNGHRYGGGNFSEKFVRVSNGAECSLGLGCKIKVFKNINLSPEIAYNTSIQFYKSEYISTEPNLFINRPFKYTDSEILLSPLAKLHLTVVF